MRHYKLKFSGMIDVVNSRCIFENCNKNPYFNNPGERKRLYCASHRKECMISIGKKCEFEDCKTIPHFNNPSEKKGKFCSKHRLEDMINVITKKCQFKNCKKKPHFNLPTEKIAIYCATHRKENMIDIKHKKCIFEGCNMMSPSFNYPDQKSGEYCSLHKRDGMVNVISKRCLTDHCDIMVSSKYNGYCLRCFIYMFPEEPVILNYRLKEKHIEDFIKKEFSNYTFINNKQISGGCSKRRPDFYMDLLTHIIIIEVDENQHEDYSCENKRMMELFLDGGSIPIVFIRINPDSYIDENNKKIKSCFKTNKLGILIIQDKKDWEYRLNTLKNRIEYHLNNVPEKEVTLEKLFFDI